MNKTLIERIIGINWRTSITGLLETIVVLGAAWAMLPEETRENPWVWGPALAAALLKTIKESQTKDKQVAGNPSEGHVIGKRDEPPRVIPPPSDNEPPKL